MHLHDSRHPGLTDSRTVGRGNYLWMTDILFWPESSRMSDQSNAEPTSETNKQERRYTPSTHPFILRKRIWNDDYDGQMIFGDLVGLKLPDICLTGEEKPRKNLAQETCPDRRSNPGSLRDTRACYRLLHSGDSLLL